MRAKMIPILCLLLVLTGCTNEAHTPANTGNTVPATVEQTEPAHMPIMVTDEPLSVYQTEMIEVTAAGGSTSSAPSTLATAPVITADDGQSEAITGLSTTSPLPMDMVQEKETSLPIEVRNTTKGPVTSASDTLISTAVPESQLSPPSPAIVEPAKSDTSTITESAKADPMIIVEHAKTGYDSNDMPDTPPTVDPQPPTQSASIDAAIAAAEVFAIETYHVTIDPTLDFSNSAYRFPAAVPLSASQETLNTKAIGIVDYTFQQQMRQFGVTIEKMRGTGIRCKVHIEPTENDLMLYCFYA